MLDVITSLLIEPPVITALAVLKFVATSVITLPLVEFNVVNVANGLVTEPAIKPFVTVEVTKLALPATMLA